MLLSSLPSLLELLVEVHCDFDTAKMMRFVLTL